jgi:hypothetical protein
MYTSRMRVITAVITDPETRLNQKLGPVTNSEFFGAISHHKITLQSLLNSSQQTVIIRRPMWSQDSVVGIASSYGLDDRGV